MTHYFLGIDVGATKSHALIADETGRALSFGQGGAGNPEGVGYDGLAEVLRSITHQALAEAKLTSDQIAGAGFGIAGYDWPSQYQPLLQIIRALNLNQARLEIVNDAIIGLLAGSATGWGVCVIAGTSCNCWGWDQQRRVGRMTGFSRLFAEAAGGSELVRKAIQVIGMAWTRRGPVTRLTEAFINLAGAASVEDLLEGLTQQRYQLTAAAAPLVFEVAAQGDAVAQDLITWAGQELADLAIGVIRQLEFEALDFEVVLAGSFYQGTPRLVEVMGECIHRVAPGAHLVRLTAPPVVGGVLLGLEQVELNPSPVREALIQSASELLKQHNRR